MNKSLTRSIGFWLLIVVSLASGTIGGWLVNSQLSTMTRTLLDNTATGVEVYVGQSLAVLGSALIAAGVIGILIALAIVAVRSLIPVRVAAPLEPIDWSAPGPVEDAPAQDAPERATSQEDADTRDADDSASVTDAGELAETPRS